jgi:DNA-binding LytR/AlgR family response regulator
MSRPTAVVAEDELPQRQALVQMLQQLWPELRIIAECEDGLGAIEALHSQRPDVAFLDVRMPGVSGLVVAESAPRCTRVVFITAYSEHAVAAFDSGATDYLLKPITRERLKRTIARLQEIATTSRDDSLRRTVEALRKRDLMGRARPLQWISATIGNSVKMIPLDEVLYFQSSDKYTRVVAKADEAIIRTSLKELAAALDPEVFWQVHRSVIVRAAAVRAMRHLGGERYEIELAGHSERMPVSAAFKGRFRGM